MAHHLLQAGPSDAQKFMHDVNHEQGVCQCTEIILGSEIVIHKHKSLILCLLSQTQN